MANKIRIKRGLSAQLPILDTAEIAFCTDTEEFVVGNASGNVKFINSKNLPYRTLEDFGGKANDSSFDNASALLNALTYCAQNGFILKLNKKYRIASNVNYIGSKPVTVLGNAGVYFSLTAETLSFANESANLFFDGGTLTIGGLGSTLFFGVGISAIGKNLGDCIIWKSFHNKFLCCVFSQCNNAITLSDEYTNWNGENQVLYCQFHKTTICYNAIGGSDCEFIGNLIHSSCDRGFYGKCAGYTISHNHFYGKVPSYFDYFNTLISDNYFQEIDGQPCFILNGSFGVNINSNKFELNSVGSRATKYGLIGLQLGNGRGNITIDGNSVHGKDLTTVTNLAFIELIYSGTKYDMPISLGNNNIRGCQAFLTEAYPLYNFTGVMSFDAPPSSGVTNLKTPTTSSIQLINGFIHLYNTYDTLTYADVMRIASGATPVVVNIKKTVGSTVTYSQQFTDATHNVSISDFSQVTKLEIQAIYPANLGSLRTFYIP